MRPIGGVSGSPGGTIRDLDSLREAVLVDDPDY
jgi:hypothetical protein